MSLFLTVLSSFALLQAQPLQAHVSSPKTFWLSLGHSTLSRASDDATWLRKQCTYGQILKSIAPVQKRASAIIVPIFKNGRCFYATSVAPFAKRNPQPLVDEKSLRSLLQSAHKQNVDVYLGLDVLGWQKATSQGKVDPFPGRPGWEELNRSGGHASMIGARYASPFNPQVRAVLKALISEVGKKFPTAAGVVLDMRLSGGEILGYSEGARTASILELGFDPLDLNISDQANAIAGKNVQSWIEWRRSVMMKLIQDLSSRYKNSRKGGRVLANGFADYYAQQSFNDYRSAQDWRGWLDSKAVDGVLLEGRWLSQYHNVEYLESFLQDYTSAPNQDSTHASSWRNIIPASHGDGLVRDSTYQRDWKAIKERAQSVEQVVAIVHNDDDIKRVVSLILGSSALPQLPTPRVGEVAPEWTLLDSQGVQHDAREWYGQRNMLWLILGTNPASQNLYTLFAEKSGFWRGQHIEPVVISTQSLELDVNTHQSVSSRPVSLPLNVLDAGSELFGLFGVKPTLVLVDKSGWIRRVETASERTLAALNISDDPTLLLKENQQAPDFIIRDMNGRLVHLSDFRGRRNVLLTFFPKCFTGGCQNHLSSLRDHKRALDTLETDIFAVSVDPPDVQLAFAERWSLQFPLIPDVGRNLSILYGSAENTQQLSNRQTVFIDKSGKVRFIDRQVNVSTHGDEVVKRIRKLRTPQ